MLCGQQKCFNQNSVMFMKRFFLVPFFLTAFLAVGQAQKFTPATLPDSVFSGEQGNFHVQGIAVDQVRGFVYCSFTDKLVKLNMSGKLIGSVTGFVGHLGDITFDPQTNKVYASLEYKNDAIGRGIDKSLGIKNKNKVDFYIAVFNGEHITRPNMNANQDSNLLRTVYLKEVVDDYKAYVKDGNRVVRHRFGCSGIDGITIGPSIGHPDRSKKYLYIAYGIYGDTTRNDNNHEVILKYDMADWWDKLGKSLSQNNPHHAGPREPLAKYFVYTGNTTYGIQNLAYDDYTGDFFVAVYRGSKRQFPNYSLFVINGHKEPYRAKIMTNNKPLKVEMLSLLKAGLKDPKTDIRGWNFKWGSTGLFPLGEGLFYISHNQRASDGQQEDMIYKYKWIGSDNEAFVLLK